MTTPRAFPHGFRVILRRRVPKRDGIGQVYDTYGNLVYVEVAQPLDHVPIWPVGGVRIATSETTTEAQDRTAQMFYAALPVDTDVDAIDVIVWNGKTWEVDGEPEPYTSPFTGTALLTVRIRRVEG